MKHNLFWALVLSIMISSCREDQVSSTVKARLAETEATSEDFRDKSEVQDLMRQALKWAESDQTIDLLPVIADSTDSVYTRFNIKQHKKNLVKLRVTNLFSTEFIKNYNQIILTLDKKLRAGDYGKWQIGNLPPFSFANDVDPWCLCQDVPYFEPWDLVEIEPVRWTNKKAELFWTWGSLGPNADPGWKQTAYRFNVVKENNRWKISYLQGFDFDENTKETTLGYTD